MAMLQSQMNAETASAVRLPGLCDVHVHLREPGFSYKETIASGSLAGARGGYTDLCAMPNLDPVPDSVEHLRPQLERIAADARIAVHPYGAITVGERGEKLADLEALAPRVIAFSDDGKGVQSRSLMKEAMERAKALGKLIVSHCEDERLLCGGSVHAGRYAAAHGMPGISSESEWAFLQRDLELVKETGCAYHACHVSTKESVALLRQAKAEGLDVSAETAPHYLLLDESCLEDDGRFKMNPPLREPADREALLAALLDGTIDMVATDHAPHSPEEKARGLAGSPFGVVGLETAFPLLYTELVRPGRITLELLLERMAHAPRRRFGIPADEGDYSLWDLTASYEIDPEDFLSKGRATPFAGRRVFGRCLATFRGGREVYRVTN